METSFTINQDLTFKESMSSTIYYFLSSKRLRLFILFLVALTTLSNLLLGDGGDLKEILQTLAAILSTMMILLIFMTILNLILRKARPSLFKLTYHFTDWGMFWSNDNKEFSKPWKEIDTFKESKAFFLLYTDKYHMHVIQKRLFKDQYDQFAFRDLVKEKLNK